VIEDGESGPSACLLDQIWVLDIRDRYLQTGVPFFFKQWDGTNKKKVGNVLKGHTCDGMPSRIQPATF
jgi:protein gp37